jgi:hypothetical protein
MLPGRACTTVDADIIQVNSFSNLGWCCWQRQTKQDKGNLEEKNMPIAKMQFSRKTQQKQKVAGTPKYKMLVQFKQTLFIAYPSVWPSLPMRIF